ncbi:MULTISPECIES: hypothetical protein [unclassified Mycoplasma]|uniref:hypothetical protein n=1 Tax=unclassified Mycoplasma TaxID=2683645 RepID=UPI00216AF39E|nr:MULTISPECIES: hypothetical protein [unclassified Mycoplasma]MCS4536923.1 hypothetical protein [Mycoplasma sp. CSL7475-4]MCT4469453.1 hypothetical protein [Mycoplasma sp. HS2188]
MTIKFRSDYNQEGKEQFTEFEAEAKYSKQIIKHPLENKEFEYDIYEFRDPQNQQLTRIEINPKSVNVITSNATLQLRFKKYHGGSQINLDKNKLFLKTLMDKCIVDPEKAHFQYELFSIADQPMGKFKITISYK